MRKQLAVIMLIAMSIGLAACAGGFPPPGNGRGILNDPDPMMGGGG